MRVKCNKKNKVNIGISIGRLARNKIQSSNKACKYVFGHYAKLLKNKKLILENYRENFKKLFLVIIENA